MRSRNIERADGAIRIARIIETIAAGILIFVAFFGLGYFALIGDELQQARIDADRASAVEAFGQ
jgi:hypothetical protein